MKPKGILYHCTANWNPSADAEMHARYLVTTDREVSWHVTVDHKKAIQHLPFDEIGWHAGDGNGEYNSNWIGVEICCNRVKYGQPLDKETYQNAVRVISGLMKELGLTELKPHKVVYGKDCPHHTLFDHAQFEKDVREAMTEEKDDVPTWAKASWEKAVNAKAIDGTRPNDALTRAEFITVLDRLGLIQEKKG
jgi:N-acetylmuramoyl-L-alanine amidase CwlA